MNYVCPDCKKPLEKVVACGCTDYFCNHCNQLVSKSRLKREQPEVNENKSKAVIESVNH